MDEKQNLDWDNELLEKYNKMYEYTPDPFKEQTSANIKPLAEKFAVMRGDTSVNLSDLIRAFLERTPVMFHNSVKMNFIKAGVKEEELENFFKKKEKKKKNIIKGIKKIFIKGKKKVIEDYKHKIGENCILGSVSSLLRYNDYDLNEEMCLGLGAGLTFEYYRNWKEEKLVKSNDRNLIIISGISFCASRVFKAMNIAPWVHKVDDNKKALKILKTNIDLNKPTIVLVDGYYLNIYPEHFGGHHTVVVGYDEGKETCFISDVTKNELFEIPIEDLCKARNSKIGFLTPDNTWYELDLPEKIELKENKIWEAIKLNAKLILDGTPINTLHPDASKLLKGEGIPGLKQCSEDLLVWTEKLNETELRDMATLMNIMIDHAGTGSGFYRPMYAKFLKQASAIVKNEILNTIGEEFNNISALWQGLGKKFFELRRRPTPKVFEETRGVIADIIKHEGEAFTKLYDISIKNI